MLTLAHSNDHRNQTTMNWTMNRLRISCWILLAGVLVAYALIVFFWPRYGHVVAHATRNTWTYQIRAESDWPFDDWLTEFQCEVSRDGRIIYMAPLPVEDSPAYKKSDCAVSLTDNGASFRVGKNVFCFEWTLDGVVWFRGKRVSESNLPPSDMGCDGKQTPKAARTKVLLYSGWTKRDDFTRKRVTYRKERPYGRTTNDLACSDAVRR